MLLAMLGLSASHASGSSSSPCANVAKGVLIGQRVETQPNITPGTTPVLFVHGINSKPTDWTGGNGRNVEGTNVPPLAYVINALGRKVTGYTFDWSSASGATPTAGASPNVMWVTDPPVPDLAMRLAHAINCIAQKSGHKVIVIAHSMGGLVTKAASRSDVDLNDIAAVFTLGTPYRGSWLASTFAGQGPSPVLNLLGHVIAAYCSVNLPGMNEQSARLHYKKPGAIESLCSLVNERNDSGVEAMRLKPPGGGWANLHWPGTFPVYPLSGSIQGAWQPLWPLSKQYVLTGAGDLVVSQSSQLAGLSGSGSVFHFSCPVKLRSDLPDPLLADLANLDAVTAYTTCFHTSEPYSKPLLDHIISVILAKRMIPTAAIPPPVATPTPSPSPKASPPSPKTVTVQVTVPANAIWADTGIHVSAGDIVAITASGRWTPNGVNYTGPNGFGYSREWPDNFFNLADLGACADCASTLTPFWSELISYTGSSPPAAGSYTSTAIAPQAKLIGRVGRNFNGPWPYSGELWLGFNDDAYSGNTSDNYGQVTATVTVRLSGTP